MSLANLPATLRGEAFSAAILAGQRVPRWRPGLWQQAGQDALHGEIFASADEASGAGAALAFALDRMRGLAALDIGPRWVLWVQDKVALKRSGRPYRPGLPPELREGLIHVAAQTPEDALFAMEEGLRCRDLVCVIGEIAGNPRALDFTASRRLSLTAEKHGVPLWLVRLGAERDLSSARMRWQVRSTASPAPRWNPAAPGMPSWRAELFRSRSHAQGEWTLRDDGQSLVAERDIPAASPDSVDLAGGSGDRPLAPETRLAPLSA